MSVNYYEWYSNIENKSTGVAAVILEETFNRVSTLHSSIHPFIMHTILLMPYGNHAGERSSML